MGTHKMISFSNDVSEMKIINKKKSLWISGNYSRNYSRLIWCEFPKKGQNCLTLFNTSCIGWRGNVQPQNKIPVKNGLLCYRLLWQSCKTYFVCSPKNKLCWVVVVSNSCHAFVHWILTNKYRIIKTVIYHQMYSIHTWYKLYLNSTGPYVV